MKKAKRALTPETTKKITADLKKANRKFSEQYPGDPFGRQAVHTIYGGAHLFSAGIAKKFSETALNTMSEYAPNGAMLGRALLGAQIDAALWARVYERVIAKLRREPIEDFRIDFEDGYGTRPDAEEDGHAAAAALQVAEGFEKGLLPPFIGIRIKPFSEPCFPRSHRTLDIFLCTLLETTKGKMPEGFVVMLPKVTVPEQTRALAKCLSLIEKKNKVKAGTLKFEFMVETTQSIIGPDGRCPLKSFADAGEGRCVAAHFGTYDYTAGSGITAAHQDMAHPACDFAKQMMKVALSGTGLLLSDGATNVMPVGPHRAGANGTLTESQRKENMLIVHRAWKMSYGHIRHSLETGFYQGWDLHPAQLPIRYAAVYAFFLAAASEATERLKGFMEKAARATLLGDVFDDAATGQGLLNFFLRGLSCGALTEDEAKATGLTLEEIQSRSFMKILEGRSTA